MGSVPTTSPPLITTPSKPPTGSVFITILIVLFLISTAATVFLFFQNRNLQNRLWQLTAIKTPPTSIITPTLTPDPTANWQTYIRQDYGFSFKYPPHFSDKGIISGTFTGNPLFIASFSDPSTVILESDAPFDGFSVYFVSNPSSSLETYLATELEAHKQSPRGLFSSSINSIKVDNKSASYVDIEQQIRRYFIPISSDKLIVFSVIRTSDDFLVTFNHVLSTFKFTDSTSPIDQVYTCPINGWQGCMPILTPEAEKVCSQEAYLWYQKNCPNFQGFAR